MRTNPLRNQPSQEAWLNMALEEQAYWLLKIIDRFRDSNSLAAKPREKEGYQLGTMLIEPDGFDHHNDQVISVVDQAVRWLLSCGFMRGYSGQSEGIFQITSKGFDLIDVAKKNNDSVDNLIAFVEAKKALETYDVTPREALGLFVTKMEATGETSEHTQISINNKQAINLSRLNKKNITLESLKKATNICKSRKWLEHRYLGSGPFDNLSITPSGLREYDARKREVYLAAEHRRIASDDGVWAIPQDDPTPSIDVGGGNPTNEDQQFEHVNNVLIENQMFVQAINNIRSAIEDARAKTANSNQLKVDHEKLQSQLLDYFDELDQGMVQLMSETDLGSNPEPVSKNTYVSNWFKNHWPEAVEKLSEFVNKKAAAEILVPTCIVAAFGLGGSVFGPLFLGATKIGGFTAGSFLGMYATGQVKSKDATKKMEEKLEDADET